MSTKVKSTHILVKFETNYGDEFDIYGFRVMKRENFDVWKKKWGKAVPTRELYFGTNESVEFETVGCYKESLTLIDIDEKKAQVIKELFGDEWGNFIDIVKDN